MLSGTFSYQGFGGGFKFLIEVCNKFFINTALKIDSHTVRLFIAAHIAYSIQPLLFFVALNVQVKRSPPDVLHCPHTFLYYSVILYNGECLPPKIFFDGSTTLVGPGRLVVEDSR